MKTKLKFPTQERLHNLFDLDFDDHGQPFFIRRNLNTKRSRIVKSTRATCNKGLLSEHLRDYINVDGYTQQLGVWVYIYAKGDYDRTQFTLDHINRNPLDNRLKNLRVVTWKQQIKNRVTSKGWKKKTGPSDEARAKQSVAMKGRRWWNNGSVSRLSFECPGPDFVRGMKPE